MPRDSIDLERLLVHYKSAIEDFGAGPNNTPGGVVPLLRKAVLPP